ncbi:uncharacterized protein LOC127435159 [Myxocyprinus asiaticus]|uniref:uncharacterized protein LOC127435159 n=1 Tax=Myxocyprinus asiaticus TaxID=70543 RepID=UPI0022216F1C|nr:uncharacterized protein LOC127435159 [Myxocyprinus asiaticus]XP_051544362.1 uncharacterized protein LOC127435159 [Myxocyprinus asiaticus]XP_051544371.1 uncharacterized protein LOC127435159 [Myxocyprinus asiaticus]
MELQQRFPVSANEYEDGEETQNRDAVKTEDLYQSLQCPPTTAHRTISYTTLASGERNWRKYGFLLFAVNILISTIILVIVGLNYSNNKGTQLIQIADGQRAGEKEVWLLHDNVFYLFWSGHVDCSTAETFCSERNASMAILTEHNMVWLQSKANGKQFLVSRASLEESGDTDSTHLDEDVDDYVGCGIMTSDVDTDQGEGFVCERVVNTINRSHTFF